MTESTGTSPVHCRLAGLWPQPKALWNPPPPFAQARACPGNGVGVEPLFSGFFGGPLFFVVPNAGLGVCDALVEGKRGSFMSVIVHSVHQQHCTTHHNPTLLVWM